MTLNRARFTIEGTPSTDLGYDATASQVLTCALEASPALVNSVRFEVHDATDSDAPLASLNCSLLTWVDSGDPSVTSLNVDDDFDIVAPGSAGHSFRIRCTVATAGEPHVFERLVTVRVGGIRKTVPAESTEYSERGWSDALNEMVDLYGGFTAAAGIFKLPCRLKTTANHGLSGLAAIDGVVPVSGNRILVGSQTLGENNGPYIAAAGVWTRATDFDASAEALAGSLFHVSEGTTQSDTWWVLTTNDPITLGATVLAFTKLPDVLSPPASPGDNNRVAFAVSGDLDYASILTTDGTTYVAIGAAASVASSGTARVAHGFIERGLRNAGGGVNADLLSWGVAANDTLALGDATYATRVVGSQVILYGGASPAWRVAAAAQAVLATAGSIRTPYGWSHQSKASDDSTNVANFDWGVLAANVLSVGDGAYGSRLYGLTVSAWVGSTLAVVIGGQGGFAGPNIGLVKVTSGSLTSAADQALLFNSSGDLGLQGHAGVSFYVGATKEGAVDQYGINGNPGGKRSLIGGLVGFEASYGALYFTSATPSYSNPALFGDQNETDVNAPVTFVAFCVGGDTRGRIYAGGAWTVGYGATTDSEADAQAGLTGACLNITTSTGTQSSVSNQMLLYNAAGKATMQGHEGSRLTVATQPLVQGVFLDPRYVVALAMTTALTSTEMPANSGSNVVYLANASTVPTADPVSGGILYAEAGWLKWRGTSGTVTEIAPA